VSLDADALAEMARNRGLKLIRSRVRTPGKPGFGLFGLAGAAGEPVFGMEGKAPAAEAPAIADYLRGAELGDWKKSLREAGGGTVKRKASREAPALAKNLPVVPAPAPSPPEKPLLRDAKGRDADQLASLFAILGHPITPEQVKGQLRALRKSGDPLLVIAQGDQVLAACGMARTLTPHRSAPVGRITILVVAEDLQRQGFGRQLVEEAERRLQAAGCELLEVTSNDRLTGAHAFYRRLGFERTSMRFAKPLTLR
jgi:ribosomal protein S18 acetylase RimI-like enzyme